jgi:hypothetical protein
MRQSVTPTRYDPNAADTKWYNPAGPAYVNSNYDSGNISAEGFSITGASGVAGNSYYIHWSRDASL